MIAMQYSFTLPADYDMEIIDRRIRDKGPMLDGYPHLAFKAYLSARKGEFGAHENRYAPFYLWDQPEGASNFLTGPGFEAVSQSFGRPQVRTWIVWQAAVSSQIGKATFAISEEEPIAPYAPLAAIRDHQSKLILQDVRSGRALASVSAFNPTNWTLIRFRLHAEPQAANVGTQAYRVGHLSLPQK